MLIHVPERNYMVSMHKMRCGHETDYTGTLQAQSGVTTYK